MLKSEDETDDLVIEFDNGNQRDICSRKWREVLNKIKELANKLKIKKSKIFDQYKEDVLRTVILSENDEMSSNLKYEFERKELGGEEKERVYLDGDKVGTLTTLKQNWRDLLFFMCELHKELQSDNYTSSINIKQPKNDLLLAMKKFNSEYEKYLKGKKTSDDKDIIMSKDDGEPATGGYA